MKLNVAYILVVLAVGAWTLTLWGLDWRTAVAVTVAGVLIYASPMVQASRKQCRTALWADEWLDSYGHCEMHPGHVGDCRTLDGWTGDGKNRRADT